MKIQIPAGPAGADTEGRRATISSNPSGSPTSERPFWRGALAPYAGEQWSYAAAALRGSSYLRLPKVLQFFSGNIGLHNVHHLSARIPNYNLQRAHDENLIFHTVPTLSLADGVRAVRLKLHDEHHGRVVTFGHGARDRPQLKP